MRKQRFIGTCLLGLGISLLPACDRGDENLSERACSGEHCSDGGDGDEQDVCGAQDTNLVAAQHVNTGAVHISNDDQSLTVDVGTSGPYELDEIHIFVGVDEPGSSPGQYPYTEEFNAPVSGHQLRVDLADLGVGCGESVNVAVHAVVVADEGEGQGFNETGWARGTEPFNQGWGSYFAHEICCEGGQGGDGGGDDGGDAEPVDEDGDNVPAEYDCDDNDSRIGALLYENHFDDDDGYLALGPKLLDSWNFDGEAHPTDGGQQALLGQPETWTGTVTFGSLRVSGVDRNCGDECEEDVTRFRAGFLARTMEDGDQDEGYHGYRCAVARNSGEDCYDPGPFVQLAAFLDGPEDEIASECVDGCAPNPTFDQLDRQDRAETTNFLEGDSGELVFWSVGEDLVCEFYGNEDEHVVARAVDDRFDDGTTGLSTLNALADFEHVRVCEASAVPAP